VATASRDGCSRRTSFAGLCTRYRLLISLTVNADFFQEAAEYRRLNPIVTPSLIPPSHINPPLPRLKPQPEHITMMIFNRRRARQKRMDRSDLLNEWLDDARQEAEFEAKLLGKGNEDREFSMRLFSHFRPLSLLMFLSSAAKYIKSSLDDLQVHFQRENRRAAVCSLPLILYPLPPSHRGRTRVDFVTDAVPSRAPRKASQGAPDKVLQSVPSEKERTHPRPARSYPPVVHARRRRRRS
jgi:hypothetical protein